MRLICLLLFVVVTASLPACSSDDEASTDTRRVVGYTPQRQPIYADPAQQAALERHEKALKLAADVKSGKKSITTLTPAERQLMVMLTEKD